MMRTVTFRRGLALAALAVAVALPARAQRTIGVGAEYQGLSFGSGLSYSAAQVFSVPLAVRYQATPDLSLDLYSAWAQGRVESNNLSYTLSGLVDTQLKATYQAAPWALVSVGANLPTGNSTHDPQEVLVASVLSSDLFGFRQSAWGAGLGITSSVATAMRAGQFGVGLAVAYAVNGKFDPYTNQDLRYQPGNETRVRIGIDRNIGTNTLTAGATFMTYAKDQANGWNLFQPGKRLRFDATYQFRAGPGVWTVYAADLWREHGDVTQLQADGNGAIVGDTAYTTPSQNLLAAGIQGSVSVGGSYVFRPSADLRLLSRKASDGNTEGSGWLMGVGGDFPLRLFGTYDFFPKAQVLFGSDKDATGVGRGMLGAEISATVRWGF